MNSNLHLTLTNFYVTRSQVPLFKPLTLTLHRGSIIQLIGANGIGKTTLLKTIQGLLSDYCGNFFKKVSSYYLPSESIFSDQETLGDVFTLFKFLFKTPEQTFTQLMENNALRYQKTRTIKSLSSGQKQRLKLMTLPLSQRCLWLLDEPLIYLDQTGQKNLINNFEKHCAGGGSILISTPEPYSWISRTNTHYLELETLVTNLSKTAEKWAYLWHN